MVAVVMTGHLSRRSTPPGATRREADFNAGNSVWVSARNPPRYKPSSFEGTDSHSARVQDLISLPDGSSPYGMLSFWRARLRSSACPERVFEAVCVSQRMARSYPSRAGVRSDRIAAVNDAAQRFRAAHSGMSASRTSTGRPAASAVMPSKA